MKNSKTEIVPVQGESLEPNVPSAAASGSPADAEDPDKNSEATASRQPRMVLPGERDEADSVANVARILHIKDSIRSACNVSGIQNDDAIRAIQHFALWAAEVPCVEEDHEDTRGILGLLYLALRFGLVPEIYEKVVKLLRDHHSGGVKVRPAGKPDALTFYRSCDSAEIIARLWPSEQPQPPDIDND